MVNSYSPLCDAFYVDMYVNTELDLPSDRDMVLSFFERLNKQFSRMGNFYRKETGDFSLDEQRGGGRYRWVTLEMDRIWAGCQDPEDMHDAYDIQRAVLEIAPYMLGVSYLDISSLDVSFAMEFDFQGKHDEVIADALLGNSAMNSLLDIKNSKPIGFSPSFTIALSEDCRLQARVAVESRTSVYDVRRNKYKESDPIILYFTIRRYPRQDEKFDAIASFGEQCAVAEGLMAEKIIPDFVKPLTSAIAQRR